MLPYTELQSAFHCMYWFVLSFTSLCVFKSVYTGAHTCVSIEVRGQPWVFFFSLRSHPHLSFLRQALLWNLEITVRLGWLARPVSPTDQPVPATWELGWQMSQLQEGAGVQLQSPRWAQRSLPWLSSSIVRTVALFSWIIGHLGVTGKKTNCLKQ